MIKKNRYGIPDGLEAIPASWKKIEAEISYYLGQVRNKMKAKVPGTPASNLACLQYDLD